MKYVYQLNLIFIILIEWKFYVDIHLLPYYGFTFCNSLSKICLIKFKGKIINYAESNFPFDISFYNNVGQYNAPPHVCWVVLLFSRCNCYIYLYFTLNLWQFVFILVIIHYGTMQILYVYEQSIHVFNNFLYSEWLRFY